MGESRVEKVGSIFSRVSGLIKSGAMKQADRPIWYDVYAAFPPKYEPLYDRPPVPAPNFREIFYPEDFVRGYTFTYCDAVMTLIAFRHFFKEFGNIGRTNLFTDRGSSISERFVAKFFDLCSTRGKDCDYERVFTDTADALSSEGVVLTRLTDRRRQ